MKIQCIEKCNSLEELTDLLNQWYPLNLPKYFHTCALECWHELGEYPEYSKQREWIAAFNTKWDSIE